MNFSISVRLLVGGECLRRIEMLVDIFSSLDYYTYIDESLSRFVIRYLFFYIGVLGICPNKGKLWIRLCPFRVMTKILDGVITGLTSDSEGVRFGGLTLGYHGIF